MPTQRRACRCGVRRARSLLYLADEPVSDTPHGEEMARVGRITLETLAQPQNEIVHRARRGKHVVTPHALEQILERVTISPGCSANTLRIIASFSVSSWVTPFHER